MPVVPSDHGEVAAVESKLRGGAQERGGVLTLGLHCLTVRIAWHYDSLLTSLIARGPALGEGTGPFTRILGLADNPTQGAAEA